MEREITRSGVRVLAVNVAIDGSVGVTFHTRDSGEWHGRELCINPDEWVKIVAFREQARQAFADQLGHAPAWLDAPPSAVSAPPALPPSREPVASRETPGGQHVGADFAITTTPNRQMRAHVAQDGAVWLRRWGRNQDRTEAAAELVVNGDEMLRLLAGWASSLDAFEQARREAATSGGSR